jgi:hypothetical protein
MAGPYGLLYLFFENPRRQSFALEFSCYGNRLFRIRHRVFSEAYLADEVER